MMCRRRPGPLHGLFLAWPLHAQRAATQRRGGLPQDRLPRLACPCWPSACCWGCSPPAWLAWPRRAMPGLSGLGADLGTPWRARSTWVLWFAYALLLFPGGARAAEALAGEDWGQAGWRQAGAWGWSRWCWPGGAGPSAEANGCPRAGGGRLQLGFFAPTRCLFGGAARSAPGRWLEQVDGSAGSGLGPG